MSPSLQLGKGVSQFLLGTVIDSYLLAEPFKFIPKFDKNSWDEYDFCEGRIEVYVDTDTRRIDAIACRISCSFEERELIGMKDVDLFRLLKVNHDQLPHEWLWVTDSERQKVYDIDDLKLQVWVSHDNYVKTLFVG